MADTAFIRTLEESGLTRPAAEAIAEALERRRRPRDDPWMLAYAALLTALLVGGFGWTAVQFNAIDGKFNAIDGKFDALGSKIDSKIDALDSKIDAHSERLTRIETLLSERLPAP
ncbi:MAG: hypothetical protein OXF88_00200 [Rhodobacteraceae bacterium]|nr:hypothetical protein [Paracoccaceae bacterium]